MAASLIEPPAEVQQIAWRECVSSLRSGESLEVYAARLKERVPQATNVDVYESGTMGYIVQVRFGEEWSAFNMLLEALKEDARR